jgi:multidrug resistance efflux pump
MDFSERLDALQQRVAAAKTAVQGAATESREQIGKRIDQAQVDLDRTVQNAKQEAERETDSARTKWAQMKADVAAKMDDAKAKIDKRNRQLDAKAAARDADWAEDDAADALDYAAWTLDNAELAMLDAIDARVHADQLAKAAGS